MRRASAAVSASGMELYYRGIEKDVMSVATRHRHTRESARRSRASLVMMITRTLLLFSAARATTAADRPYHGWDGQTWTRDRPPVATAGDDDLPLERLETWQRPSNFQYETRLFANPQLQNMRPGGMQRAFDEARTERHAIIQPMLERLAHTSPLVSRTVVVMLVNSGQLHLLLNFGCRCRARGINWKSFTFVYALDEAAYTTLRALGIASYRSPLADIAEAAKIFGDPTFARVVWWKNAVVHDVLQMGFNLLFQDVDIVWRADLRPFFFERRALSVDMFWQYDGGNHHQQPHYANSGFIFIRDNYRSRLFWREAFLLGHTLNSQQMITNPLLTHHFFNHGLKLHILSSDWAGGPQLGLTRETTRLPPSWRIAHASWTHNHTNKVVKLSAIDEWDSACVERLRTRAAEKRVREKPDAAQARQLDERPYDVRAVGVAACAWACRAVRCCCSSRV